MALPKSHRTGGPRTAAGRQAVTHNALRTGAYSARAVLPGEDLAQFQELEQQFIHDFAPADVAEGALVQQLAVIAWKKLRLHRIEHNNYLGFLNRPFLSVELDTVTHLLPPLNPLEWVNAIRHTGKTEREALATVYELATRLGVAPPEGYPPDTVEAIRASAPKLYQHLHLMANEYDIPVAESDWTTQAVIDDQGVAGLFLERACVNFCQDHWYADWLLHHRDEADQALQLLQDRRLLLNMQQSSLGRIHDDMDRAFQRTLSELRRHQNWRRDRATLTVEADATRSSVVSSSTNQTNSH